MSCFVVAPVLVSHHKSAGELEQEVSISCAVWSYPAAHTIEITRNGHSVVSDEHIIVSDVTTSSENTKYNQKSRTLTFRSIRPVDYGSYLCRASNSVDESTNQLVLQEPGKEILLINFGSPVQC